MKKNVFLVNTARGGIINETDLFNALKDKQINGAGIDAFITEPPLVEDSPLLSLGNVIATPHIAGSAREAGIKVATATAEEVLRVLGGKPTKNAINSEIFDTPAG